MSEGVSTRMMGAVRAMYETVKVCIRYKTKVSDSAYSHLGVKQGNPLSPLLFMIFITDICANVDANVNDIFTIDEVKVFMLLYADDAVLFGTSSEILQHVIDEVKRYSASWNNTVNTEKN
jgi:hypothetical protein